MGINKKRSTEKLFTLSTGIYEVVHKKETLKNNLTSIKLLDIPIDDFTRRTNLTKQRTKTKEVKVNENKILTILRFMRSVKDEGTNKSGETIINVGLIETLSKCDCFTGSFRNGIRKPVLIEFF